MTEENQEQQKPKKDLELLSCTAEFYIAMQERSLSAYEAKPLSVSNQLYHSTYNALISYGGEMEKLRRSAKNLGCEVVTDVRQIRDGDLSILMGTGLILRQEKP